MTDEVRHTPTPWSQSHRRNIDGMYRTQIYDEAGEEIATLAWFPVRNADGSISTSRASNASHIVRCVNEREDFLRYREIVDAGKKWRAAAHALAVEKPKTLPCDKAYTEAQFRLAALIDAEIEAGR